MGHRNNRVEVVWKAPCRKIQRFMGVNAMAVQSEAKLKKRLGLLDVYVISTGAMFASGFFLLPGIAAAKAGPSVILAYLAASLVMIPATLAIAELSTTMPRAGGPYFVIDRSFGPVMGTIGGMGAWLVLLFKSSFALVGFGAYLALVLELPVEPLAMGLTVVFACLNIFGVKESARLQRVLVMALVVIMGFYVVNGLWWAAQQGFGEINRERMTPFFPFGLEVFPSTVGMVFVSYAGLTKVANVAEEVKHPERNLPLGMAAALLTVTLIYVLGVYVMLSAIPPEILHQDLTPVATAAQQFLGWMPAGTGLALVLAAAFSAFASTGNAGLMAASRLPMALARDGLAAQPLEKVSRFGTPAISVLVTAGFMILAIGLLNVEALARMGSAFLLFVFVLLNLSVIVFRESRIASYVPVFPVPLYPWTPIAGVLSSMALILVLGWQYVLFLAAVITISLVWYRFYAAKRVERRGAIYNLFERLAKRKHESLEEELWTVLKERGPSEYDLFDEVVARSRVIDIPHRVDFRVVILKASQCLAGDLQVEVNELARLLEQSGGPGGPPVASEAVLVDLYLPSAKHPHLVLARLERGIGRDEVGKVIGDPNHPSGKEPTPVIYAALFLVSPEKRASQHLRILSELSARMDDPAFLLAWLQADSPEEIREVFLRTDRYLLVRLKPDNPCGQFMGKRVKDLSLPAHSSVAAIHRNGEPLYPHPEEILEENDRLILVGEPEAIQELYEQIGPLCKLSS